MMDMCYPSAEAVAAQIVAARDRWGVPAANIFLATDSPRPELFEDILRDRHGLRFARYGQQGPTPALGEEYSLPVDQVLCAAAPFFLGNVGLPSRHGHGHHRGRSVRDTMGWVGARAHRLLWIQRIRVRA